FAAEAPAADQRSAEVESALLPLDGSAAAPLDARMQHYHVPAVSIAVIDHGRLAWAKAYGVLGAYDPHPADADTLFQAASISKPLAAVAALEMIGEGRLAP